MTQPTLTGTLARRVPILGKLIVLGICLTAGYGLMVQAAPLAQIVGLVLVGAMFAHAVELQHQCVHGLAFRSKRLNRWVGLLLGAPMLVSFTHYRGRHLHHHRFIGTPGDSEFFAYDVTAGLSWAHLAQDLFGYSRLKSVARNFAASLGLSKATDAHLNTPAKSEYLLLLAILIALVVVAPWVTIKFWLFPLLLVAAPVHFLIELPEHLLCARLSRDYGANSRSIEGTWFSRWLTNGNNFHVEHHADPSLPIERLSERFAATPRSEYRYLHRTYPEFYRLVLNTLRDGASTQAWRTAP